MVPKKSGSITVTYEGGEVTTHYSSFDSPLDVAMNMKININNHPTIQVHTNDSPFGTTVILTEKRAGCLHNGKRVWVESSPGTHIIVNGYEFVMSGGTDDGIGCDPPPIPDPPSTPALKSPPNGAIVILGHQNNIKFEWHPATGATSYRLQVADNPSFNPIGVDLSLSSTSATIINLPAHTNLYWRVRAFNSGGSSSWSNTWSCYAFPWLDAYSLIFPHGQWGTVDMMSISEAGAPIDYMRVRGLSFKEQDNFWNLLRATDREANNTYLFGVGYAAYKWPNDPATRWLQEGHHWFRHNVNGQLIEIGALSQEIITH